MCLAADKVYKFTDFPHLLKNIFLSKGLLYNAQSPEHVLLDYSSPNLAKFFHAGHLRSTLIGNYTANLFGLCGKNVTKINYIGDTGYQIALLLYGLTKLFNQEIVNNTITMAHLNTAYRKMNMEKPNENDVTKILEKLHNDTFYSTLLDQIKNISFQEYKKVYQALRVNFDDYEYESNYIKNVKNIIYKLQKIGKIRNENGSCLYNLKSGETVCLQKSNTLTLYLARDIAAALHRIQEYHPDSLYYFVDIGQDLHFQALFEILTECFPDETHNVKFKHVKFGRVIGMRSRDGTNVYINDIINEGTNKMRTKLLARKTTKIDRDTETIDYVAKQLALSSIIVNTLNQTRGHSYHFSWKDALNDTKESGNLLQYTHSRLYNIERKWDYLPEIQAMGFLNDPMPNLNETQQMILNEIPPLILEMKESVYPTLENFEPKIYLRHLFKLCHKINHAYNHIHINQLPTERSKLYMLYIFHCMRLLISQNLRLLGLEPLNKC